MKRNIKKWMAVGVLCLMSASSTLSYAQTVSATTGASPKVAQPLTTSGTLFVDGVQDFKISFNDKLIVTEISSWSPSQNAPLDMKGKPLSVVMSTLKSDLLPSSPSVHNNLPVMIGLSDNIKKSKQLLALNQCFSETFKTQAVITQVLDQANHDKIMATGSGYLMTMYRESIEALTGINGITQAQLETVMQSEKFMSLVGLHSDSINYKKANGLSFDTAQPAVIANSTESDDDEDDHDDDHDHDDED